MLLEKVGVCCGRLASEGNERIASGGNLLPHEVDIKGRDGEGADVLNQGQKPLDVSHQIQVDHRPPQKDPPVIPLDTALQCFHTVWVIEKLVVQPPKLAHFIGELCLPHHLKVWN